MSREHVFNSSSARLITLNSVVHWSFFHFVTKAVSQYVKVVKGVNVVEGVKPSNILENS